MLQHHQLRGEAAIVEIAAGAPRGIERLVVVGDAAMLEAPETLAPSEEAILRADVAIESPRRNVSCLFAPR